MRSEAGSGEEMDEDEYETIDKVEVHELNHWHGKRNF